MTFYLRVCYKMNYQAAMSFLTELTVGYRKMPDRTAESTSQVIKEYHTPSTPHKAAWIYIVAAGNTSVRIKDKTVAYTGLFRDVNSIPHEEPNHVINIDIIQIADARIVMDIRAVSV